jgi:hypothetical protein
LGSIGDPGFPIPGQEAEQAEGEAPPSQHPIEGLLLRGFELLAKRHEATRQPELRGNARLGKRAQCRFDPVGAGSGLPVADPARNGS